MSYDLESIKKSEAKKTPLTVIHGTPGIGKTTFAAGFPKPLFILTEDGLGSNEVDAFPLCGSMDNVFAALETCYKLKEGEKETLVIDSLSALEFLIWEKVASDHGKKNIEDIGYAKGYIYALDYWRDLTLAVKGLLSRGVFKNVILIAHSDISRFESPDSESYDRNVIKLHKRAFQFFYEQADIIGFASQPIFIKKVDESSKERAIAKDKGGAVLYLKEKPSLIAKNRYGMPDSIPFTSTDFLEALHNKK
tara:strand:- start:383 stop:1132 length:750 start_codon:yes stop_codon:yes gene_type:complete